MKKLMAVVVLGLSILWCTAAFADYASLGEDGQMGPYWGVGGIFLSGKDATGATQTDFLPTVNLSGVNDMWAWQLFYGFGGGSSIWGGSADYIIADNMDECATCPDNGIWWFGVGPTIVNYNGILEDGTGANGVNGTDFGPNLGFGYNWDKWSFQLYAHYLVDNQTTAGQASINYSFN